MDRDRFARANRPRRSFVERTGDPEGGAAHFRPDVAPGGISLGGSVVVGLGDAAGIGDVYILGCGTGECGITAYECRAR